MKERNDAREALERMHLQWFADAQEDDETVDEDEPDEDDEDNFEILVEGRDEIPEEEPEPTEEGPSRDELMSELEALKQQQQQANSQLGDRQTLESGFDKLSRILEQQQQGQASQQQQKGPQESPEQFKKRITKNFYDDPAASIEEMIDYAIQSKIAPAFQQTHDMVSKTAMSTSKQVAASNPTNKLILDRFGDEVEAAVKSLSPGPDVYDRACQQVGMSHFTDIVQAQVEEAVNGGSNEGSNAASTGKKPTSNVNPAGNPSRGAAPKASKAKKRVLTKDQRAAADRMGLTYESAWRYFNEK